MGRLVHIPGIFEPEPPPVDVAKVVFSLLIVVVGLIGNLFAIFVILVLREYKKSVINLYVLHLAIADSLFLLTLPFKVNEDILHGWIYPDWMCKAKETILFLNYYASILFLVWMSIDRYIAVCRAFKPIAHKLRTPTSAFIIALSFWSIALLLCIPVMKFSYKIGVHPYCDCSYEFPQPPQNVTADCLEEKFTSEDDLLLCQFTTTIPEVNNGEPYCKLYDRQVLINRLGSGSGISESGDPEHAVATFNGSVLPFGNVNIPNINFTSQDFRDAETNVHTFEETTAPGFGERIIEMSGENSTQSTRFSIPDACHYWNHPLSWKVFIGFNFIVMFCLPFLIMSICYGLIVQRLSKTAFRATSVNGQSSQKKKPASRSSQDRRRVTIMCAALVSSFLLCWLPFHAIHFAKFVGINATEEYCTIWPKIGALLAYFSSALNPYLYSFLGTNFSKKWKMLKQSQGIRQFVSLAIWKQNDHSTSGGTRRENDRTSRQGGHTRYHRQPSSDNKISTQRPTMLTRVPKDMESSQATPSMQTGYVMNGNQYTNNYSSKSSHSSYDEGLMNH